MIEAWQWGDLEMFAYDVMVLDCPWDFEVYEESTGAHKSGKWHYETMTESELMRIRPGELAAPHCLVMIWATGWGVATGLVYRLCVRWGVTPITEIVWDKRTRNGKRSMGPGYRVRTMHEPIILGTFGKPKHKPFPSVIEGLRREHSRKPDEFYTMIAKHTPGARRCDLFSRGGHPGFEAWGKETGKFDGLKPGERFANPPKYSQRARFAGSDPDEQRRLF